jgi:Flp pilus assembly secretin CpaC/tetratricopeptide (TPR) repeat protein
MVMDKTSKRISMYATFVFGFALLAFAGSWAVAQDDDLFDFGFSDDSEAAMIEEEAPAVDAEIAVEAMPAEEAEVTAESEPEAAEVAAEPEIAGVEEEITEPMMPEELSVNERIRRQELRLLGEQAATEAAEQYRQGNYEAAIEQYKRAKAYYLQTGKAAPVAQTAADIDRNINAAYVDWAMELAAQAEQDAAVDQFDMAIQRLRTAIEFDPSREAELKARIGTYMELKKQARFETEVREENVDVGKEERQYRIKVLTEQAEVLFNNEQYTDAREKFEEILTIDPYDITAIRYLRKINQRLDEIGEERRQATRAGRMAQVMWKWNDPVKPMVAGGEGVLGGAPVPKVAESKVQEKLREIVVPKIDFEEATIHQVVSFLKQKSKELDPEGVGVNFFLKLRPAAGAGAAAEMAEMAPEPFADDWSDFDDFGAPPVPTRTAPAAPTPSRGGVANTITMNMDNIELGEAIKYICLGAGLYWRVESNAVVISDQPISEGEMRTEFYPVKAGFFQTQRTREAEGLVEWGVSESEAPSAGGTDADQVRAYFENLGVVFPENSSVAYEPKTSKLIVHNSETNHQRIQKILRELNITPTQVTIEAKFVEINQEDLEGIGFQWMVENGLGGDNADFSISDQTGDKQVIPVYELIEAGGEVYESLTGYDVIEKPLAGIIPGRLSAGVRSVTEAFGIGADSGILGVSMVLGAMEFSTLINAISQAKSSDILSAPKVTTQSGSTAVIRMVQERYFPEGWTEPEITAEEGIVSLVPSMPEYGEARDVGVVLDVTPQVESDGYTIGLQLRPQVVEFLGYDLSNNTSIITELGVQEFKAQMPILEARTVDTNVIVYDGETVILGGMIREANDAFEDKVPVIGDLPLVGRLFRSRGQRVVKRNLLIFVTARLVDPAGQPLRRQEAMGLPDFKN